MRAGGLRRDAGHARQLRRRQRPAVHQGVQHAGPGRIAGERRWPVILPRARMLHALMDGRALTASELARVAGITPQTASTHLARLCVAGLLEVEKQGRHRYHRLASPAVAQMMESIMLVASRAEPSKASSRLGRAMPRCAPPAPATTTSPAVSGSRSRTPWWPKAKSSWRRTAA